MNGRPHGACRPHLPIPGYRVVAYLSPSGRRWRLRPRRGQSRAHSLPAVSGHINAWNRQPASACSTTTPRRLELTQAGGTLRLCPQHRRAGREGPRQAARHADPRPPAHRRFGGLRQRLAATRPATLSPLAPEASIELRVGITTDLLRQQAQGAPTWCSANSAGGSETTANCSGRNRWSGPRRPRSELPVGEPLPLALFPEPCVYREAAITALGAAAVPGAWCSSASMAGCLSAALAGFAVDGGGAQPDAQGAARTGPGTGFSDAAGGAFTPSRANPAWRPMH